MSSCQIPSRMGSRPRNPIGSGGRTSDTPNPIMLMMIIIVNPMYWPVVILRGVMVFLVDASAKKVASTNMSSMFVMAKELHAVPIDFPNCIVDWSDRTEVYSG